MDLPADDQDLIDRLHALADSGPIVVAVASTKPVEGPSIEGIDGCLARLGKLEPGDIPCLIRILAMLGDQDWSPAGRAEVNRLQDLCDQLIQELVPDQAAAFASIRQAAALLIADRSRPPVPVVAVPEPTASIPAPAPDLSSERPPAADVLDDFVSETGDLLADVERIMLTGHEPGGEDVAALFRSFHTIKGMAAYLNLPRIEKLAHGVEDQLGPVRDGLRPMSADLRPLILAGIDGLRAMTALVREQRGDSGPLPEPATALATLLHLTLPDQPVTPATAAAAPVENVPRLGDLLEEQGIPRTAIEHAAATLSPGERLGDKLVQEGAASRDEVEQAAAKQQAAKLSNDGFTRVSIGRLDELMNMVGELLIAQAMVSQEAVSSGATRLSQMVTSQGRILRDLQVLSLSLRMVPLKSLFQKMARAIHDTAKKVGKDIEFRMVGEDTEVDRTLAETLADPLMHMVRNAVDHGVDSAEERAKSGKPAKGVVTLTAGHSGDAVIISLMDDGRGMDPEKLRAKAVKTGLIPADKVLTPQEAYQLVFLPGFSTAATVTGISGRGVGMDVVRRNITAMKGKVDIASTLGSGTTFTISLPLTTAILDAMVLKVGGERFLIPLSSIIHALRPAPGDVQTVLGGGRVIESRGELLPVVSLAQLFTVPESIAAPEQSILVVFEHFGGRVALHVDDILGQQQVVIKPLDRQYAHHQGLAGTAILGDGRVGLIIDPGHLVAASKTS